MIAEGKVTEIFCIVDDFCKEFEAEIAKNALSSPKSARTRCCKRMMSDAEVITPYLLSLQLVPQLQTLLSWLRVYCMEAHVPATVLLQPLSGGNAQVLSRFCHVPQACMFWEVFRHKLFDDGIHIVTGLRSNMKQRLMPLYDKIMLRKRSIIESVNDMLKNVAQLVHTRHRSVHNFIMNLLAALGAYCFFAV